MINYNKKLIFKKFFLDNTQFFFICLLSLSIIVWVIQAVNFLDFVTEDGHSLLIYIKYTLLNLPKIISRLMPFIFFVAICYSINNSEDKNELKIFWINGIDKKNFLNIVLRYSIIYLILQIFLNSVVIPFCQNKARTYIQTSSIDFFPSLINEKKFIDTVEKLTIYIEKKDKQNNYKNIFLKDVEDLKNTKIIYASNGILKNSDQERSLFLTDGKIININEDNITAFDFKSTSIDLSKYLTKSIIDFKIQEKDSYLLVSCYINFHILNDQSYYHILDCNESSFSILQQELYKRFVKPFYYIAVAISACFLLLFSKESINLKYYRSFTFILGAFILIFSELSASFSGKSFLNFKLSIISLILIILFQYFILYRKMRFTR